MELLQLRYFLESAKNENFSKTAELYSVPTTSVSAAIHRLENEIGVRLFDRSANRIRLNAAGRNLYMTLSESLRNLDETISELSVRNSDSRKIRILVRGVRRRLTKYLTEYAKKHPQVPFSVFFYSRNTSPSDYDIIIDGLEKNYPEFTKFELCKSKFVVKASKACPLVGKELTFSDLRNWNFVTTGEDGYTHNALLKNAKKSGFSPKITATCNDVECFEAMIASGLWLAIAVYYPTEYNPNIVPLNVLDFSEESSLCCYYREADYYGNMKSIIDYLRSMKMQTAPFRKLY